VINAGEKHLLLPFISPFKLKIELDFLPFKAGGRPRPPAGIPKWKRTIVECLDVII
jgi:hypothetical protein